MAFGAMFGNAGNVGIPWKRKRERKRRADQCRVEQDAIARYHEDVLMLLSESNLFTLSCCFIVDFRQSARKLMEATRLVSPLSSF